MIRCITVAKDILRYASVEVPERVLEVYGNQMGVRKSIEYPLLVLTRRVCYDIDILRSRRFLKQISE